MDEEAERREKEKAKKEAKSKKAKSKKSRENPGKKEKRKKEKKGETGNELKMFFFVEIGLGLELGVFEFSATPCHVMPCHAWIFSRLLSESRVFVFPVAAIPFDRVVSPGT